MCSVLQHVLNASELLRHILNFAPISSLSACNVVCKDWNLVTKYLVPVPLFSLKTFAIAGELLYWLPGENQFPKTVSLQLVFENQEPSYLQIIEKTDSISYKFSISDILFVVEGHWTPIFEILTNYVQNVQQIEHAYESEDENQVRVAVGAAEVEFADEEQMFARAKCFSIVCNTYMTYDFLSFTENGNRQIVRTLRSIIRQKSSIAKKMAIHTKANNLYINQEKPLIFSNYLAILHFEMFVILLQNYMKCCVERDPHFNIPLKNEKKITARCLYPLLLAKANTDNLEFSEWKQWIQSQIEIYSKEETPEEEEKEEIFRKYTNKNKEMKKKQKQMSNRSKSKKMHVRRQSSLFGQKSFPADENVDLFAILPSLADADKENEDSNASESDSGDLDTETEDSSEVSDMEEDPRVVVEVNTHNHDSHHSNNGSDRNCKVQ